MSTKLPGQALLGVEPVALALNRDETRLYVADAGANAIAVLDATEDRSASSAARSARIPAKLAPRDPLGFFPTDWYPQALAFHGDDLMISCGKAHGSGAADGAVRTDENGNNGKYAYVFELLHGSLAIVNVKDADRQLAESTKAVVATNTGFEK